ncbi:MAG: hypothetical protein ABJH08_11630 [Balneola sp.]
MIIKKVFLASLLSLFFSSAAFSQISKFKATFIKAQQENKEVVVTLSDENTFSGTVVSIDDESAGVKTPDGLFNFRYDRIINVKIVDPNNTTSRWRENPAKNKLFITQTGKMLDAGSGYYQNTYIFFSNFSYGISNYLSVDAGFSMIPGIDVLDQMFSIGAKAGTSFNNTISISGNIKYYKIFDIDEGVTSLFGSFTYSRSRLDLTAGTGIGFSSNSTSNALLILGGQFRLTERFALLSENIILPAGDTDTESLISFGGRVIGSKSAFDLGFFAIADENLVPFVSYTLKF